MRSVPGPVTARLIASLGPDSDAWWPPRTADAPTTARAAGAGWAVTGRSKVGQGRRGWLGRRAGRIPAWLLLAVIQASTLAVLMLGGLIAYQGDQLCYLPTTATEPPSPRVFHWRSATTHRLYHLPAATNP